jgi:hypothetical protein
VQQYWARSTPYKFVPVNVFAAAFEKFDLGRSIKEAAMAPFDKSSSHRSALVRTQYTLRAREMFKATMKREWTLMVRNRFLYIFRTFQVRSPSLASRYCVIFLCSSWAVWVCLVDGKDFRMRWRTSRDGF